MSQRSIATTVLMVLAVLYTLYFARVVLLPFTFAFLLYLLFAPTVKVLKRFSIPSGLSAALILVTLIAVLFGGIAALKAPAAEWMSKAPTNLRQLTRQFSEIKAPLEDIKDLGDEVEEITKLDTEKVSPTKVEIKVPTPLDEVMKGIPSFAAALIITVIASFFLLAGGDEMTRKLLMFGRTWKSKRKILMAARQIQHDVSRYLRTVTFINILLGLAVTVLMWVLEVPNPELWGAMAAILNFAPYVGAIINTIVLTVVGAATFPTLGEAMLVPGLYLLLNGLEGMLLTPLLLGRSLRLNPLAVLMAVVFWGWMWGVMGALMAVPLLSVVKVILDHIDATRPIANLMVSEGREAA